MSQALNSLLMRHTRSTVVQLLRYTIVGGLAFVVDFSTLFLLSHYLGFHYLASAACGFVLGLMLNYLLSRVWVFGGGTMHNKRVEFLIFSLIGLIGLGLTEAMMWLLVTGWGLHYMFSKLLTTVLVYLWNFFARKYTLFNK